MGAVLRRCTCSSGQLQRGLCVVFHPVLQGPLHVGSGIQQQLWRSGGDRGKHEGEEGVGRQRRWTVEIDE